MEVKVFVYVVSASKNPDAVECLVPYKVNDQIFFGPCKRRLRENIYEQYLKNNSKGDVSVDSENLYIVGVNGSNPQKIRKIIWVGKIQKILTFEKAYSILSSDRRFKGMMDLKDSPLHLEPLHNNKIFIGYRLRSEMHKENDEWVLDIMKRKEHPNVEIKDKSLILKDPSKRNEIFVRDCCFLCKNLFFAGGKGIDIDEKILNIFKEAQHNPDINNYAIFGLSKDGRANGLRGGYLVIEGELGRKLIEILKMKASKVKSPLKMITQRRCKC